MNSTPSQFPSTLNRTHDPAATSWVASAQAAGTDFPIQNLPFAVFRHRDSQEGFRGGIAIGDQVLDLWDLTRSDLLDGLAQEAAEAKEAAAKMAEVKRRHDEEKRVERLRGGNHVGQHLRAQLFGERLPGEYQKNGFNEFVSTQYRRL